MSSADIAKHIIQNNKKLLRLTVEDAQEEIFWLAKNGKILYANESAYKNLDYSLDEILTMNYIDINADLERKSWFKFWNLLKNDLKHKLECYHISKSGTKIPVSVAINYYRIVDKEFITLFSHSIAQRVRAEAELKTSEERFRLIADSSVDIILHLNRSQKIEYASPVFFKYFSNHAKKINDFQFTKLISPDYTKSFKAGFAKSLAGEKVQNIELKSIDENYIFDVSLVPFNSELDEVRVQLILHDITKRKQVEQHLEYAVLDYENTLVQTELLNHELETEVQERKRIGDELIVARKEAEKANKAKSEFLANMSHEIRTPLNAVLGFSEILKDKLKDNPEFTEYIDGINTGGTSLLSLINDILDLSKIEAGKLDIQKEPLNPLTLFTEVSQIFGTKLRSKGLELIQKVDKNLPQAVLMDQTRVRQVLFNLVGNAIKFTATGNVTIAAEVKKDNPENNTIDLTIEVADTGIGIPRKQQRMIFDPFMQQDGQDNRKYGGTGLGLSITRRLVEMMDGSITVESRIGKGAKFSVHFRDVVCFDAQQIDKEQLLYDSNSLIFEGAQVLIAEDNLSNQKVFTGLLEGFNLDITIVNNGNEVLEFLKSHSPNLILMDLKMSEMDGFETTRRIRKGKQRTIPVVAVSASLINSFSPDEINLFNDSLTKPVTKTKLLEMIAKFVPHSFTASSKKTPIQYLENNQERLLENAKAELEADANKKMLVSDKLAKPLEELVEFIDIEDVNSLCEIMDKLSAEYEIKALSSFSRELSTAASTFQLSKIESLIVQLSSLLKNKSQNYEL